MNEHRHPSPSAAPALRAVVAAMREYVDMELLAHAAPGQLFTDRNQRYRYVIEAAHLRAADAILRDLSDEAVLRDLSEFGGDRLPSTVEARRAVSDAMTNAVCHAAALAP